MKRRHCRHRFSPAQPGKASSQKKKMLPIRRLCALIVCILLTFPLLAVGESPLTIAPGEESERVLQLQNALVSLGYKCGTVDGKYGSATENAIRRFQKNNGLIVDGLAGKTTQALIYRKLNEKNATPEPGPTSTPAPPTASYLPHQVFLGNYTTMMQGSSGNRVTTLQSALTVLGFYHQQADGNFGLGTHRAVVAFQKSKRLRADGLAGKSTLHRIEDALLAASQSNESAATPPPAPPPSSSPRQTTQPGQLSLFAGDYTTISKGAKGTRVITLQTALNTLGYSTGKVDGTFGQSTYNALVRFQRDQKLHSDGLAGKTTLKRIEAQLLLGINPAETTAPSPTTLPTQNPVPQKLFAGNYATLSMGNTGDRVTALQSGLIALGYYTGQADGTFGQGTRQAVVQFQSAQSLKADGMAGKSTLKKLEALLVNPTPAPAPTAAPTVTDLPVPSPVYPMLQLGSTGNAVTLLQQGLKSLSYPVEVTGTYDSITKAAVEAFQRLNRLTPDGVAGEKTQVKLFSGHAASYQADAPTLPPGEGAYDGPAASDVQLLHWFNEIKPTIRAGQTILVYDPSSRLAWTLRLYSLGRHADAEPLTATDTAVMYKAFGSQFTWNQKAVYVRLPSGTWTLASTHDMPHLSGSIKDNNFDGHLCVHFLRDLKEAQIHDPSYGVANQKTIRATWKKMTGQDVIDNAQD